MATRIMIVEDDDLIRQLLYYQLSGAGYDVICIKSGLQALDQLLRDQPDLVLLDVMMPDLSGWETCQQIRGWSNVPIIMLTAKGAEDDVVAGLKVGADDYVTKPFSLPLLLARIEAVLRRRGPAEQVLAATPRYANGERTARSRPELARPVPEAPTLHTSRYASSIAAPSLVPATAGAAIGRMSASISAPSVPVDPGVPPSALRIGRQLYQLRRARKATLEQASQGCGVRWDFLQSLEQGQFNSIPRSELRQALRSYSAYLGFDLQDNFQPRPASSAKKSARWQIPLPMLLLICFAIALVIVGLVMLYQGVRL